VIVKFLLVGVTAISTYVQATSIIVAIAMVTLLATNWYLQPCLGEGVVTNHWRNASFAGASWGALCAVVVGYVGTSATLGVTIAYASGIVPVMVSAWFLSRKRSKYLQEKGLSDLLQVHMDSDVKVMKSAAQQIAKLSLIGNLKDLTL
jgi:hypothetical protein